MCLVFCGSSVFSGHDFIFISANTSDEGCWVFILVPSVEGNFLVILIGYVITLVLSFFVYSFVSCMCLHMSPHTHTKHTWDCMYSWWHCWCRVSDGANVQQCQAHVTHSKLFKNCVCVCVCVCAHGHTYLFYKWIQPAYRTYQVTKWLQKGLELHFLERVWTEW